MTSFNKITNTLTNMKNIYKKLINYLENAKWIPTWLKESNRIQHFLLSIPAGLIGGMWFVLGLALGMEYKDKAWGGKFDYLDLSSTLLGGMLGSLLRLLILPIF